MTDAWQVWRSGELLRAKLRPVYHDIPWPWSRHILETAGLDVLRAWSAFPSWCEHLLYAGEMILHPVHNNLTPLHCMGTAAGTRVRKSKDACKACCLGYPMHPKVAWFQYRCRLGLNPHTGGNPKFLRIGMYVPSTYAPPARLHWRWK